ncbi:MAG: SCO2322 family protein, partial [Nocardioidaceae bacterium]
MATLRRLLLATALAVVIAPTLQVLHPGTADAAAYRYWGFLRWSDGAWSFASKGPDAMTPKDGSVDGWRYAVAGKKTPPRLPRAAGDFDQVCGTTPAEAGHKRVGVVLDYGLASEAPDGT